MTSQQNKTGYFILEPEVAGVWGEEIVVDTSVHPPDVKHLDYCFETWPEDGILEVFPCFIVRKELREELLQGAFSGISFEDVTVSKNELFHDLYESDPDLPEFVRLIVTGKKNVDDFWIDEQFCLVVSSPALDVLRKHGLSNADITPFSKH